MCSLNLDNHLSQASRVLATDHRKLPAAIGRGAECRLRRNMAYRRPVQPVRRGHGRPAAHCHYHSRLCEPITPLPPRARGRTHTRPSATRAAKKKLLNEPARRGADAVFGV